MTRRQGGTVLGIAATALTLEFFVHDLMFGPIEGLWPAVIMAQLLLAVALGSAAARFHSRWWIVQVGLSLASLVLVVTSVYV